MNPFHSMKPSILRTLALLAVGLMASVVHAATNVSGAITANTTWTAANSPYVVTGNVTVSAAATLTIEPGVVVQFGNGLGLSVAGRLLAEGDPGQRILFTRASGATSWTRLDFTANALESRIAFADIEYATSSGNIRGSGTSLHIENVTWSHTSSQLLNLSNCSITLLDSVFPTISGAEPYHHSGLPSSGHAIVRGCVFGSTTGLNDIIDFTGGQRPGAILQLRDNVFLGASDDVLDLDGTDAHIEGNIFLHVHAGDGPNAADTASAVSGGSDGGRTSRITIVRNLFYDCDHGILCKEGNFYVVQNNTFVDMLQAVANFDEPLRSGITPGAGLVFEDNIAWSSPTNFQNAYLADPVEGTVALRVRRNLLSGTDRTNDFDNVSLDPLFVGTNGITAANIRALFALQTNSPAKCQGAGGLDLGALVPPGATISGAPNGTTTNTAATLKISGPGIVAYRWQLNGGAWSAPTPLTNSFAYSTNLFDAAVPITLSGLTNGGYTVAVVGQDSAGVWQDATNAALVSWSVDTSGPPTELVFNGPLISNTVWTAALPIHVTGTVTVPTNLSLTIQAGAQVKLAAGASILANVGGTIDVAGTKASPVLFRSLDGASNWARLGAEGAGASLTLRHADTEHGQVAVLDGASGLIENSYLHDYRLSSGGTLHTQPIIISERAASIVVRATHVRNYYETLFRLGVITIEDSLFEEVTGDAVDFDTASPGSVIRRCTFRQGNQSNVDAVDLGSQSHGVTVEYCVMHDFPFDKGVSIGEQSSNIVVRSCLIYAVDVGIAIKDSSDALVVGNTIVESAFALRLYEKIGGQGPGSATAWNNIFWNNTNAVVLLDGSTIDIHHSDIAGGYTGQGNLDADPLFRNAMLHDYRLLPGSPAIGTGTNATSMGALGAIGSYLVDTDMDGLPDPWELEHDLDFNSAADAAGDTDKDGLTAAQEYLAGTSPTDPASVLRANPSTLPGSIQFTAVAGRDYRVEYRTNLTAGVWQTLVEIPAANTNVAVSVTDPSAASPERFYRIVLPPRP